KEQLVKAFVSTEAAHSTATSLSVKRYFRKFSFLLNRLRRPSNHLPISGRRILQRSNSLSSTSMKLRFESLSGPNRCGGQPVRSASPPLGGNP
ncbi:hypothetical protein NEA11_00005, partial [Pseudomonas aeruginosa]|nr:hypothetical protein [Pseudomonas aeruginosa]MBW6116620.1 hypothetical protein [Pseudomonas aeruginosa]MCA4129222.1 hypothetical protein [Pseudomonas aeruginosa]MCG0169305.1 hypothetical protein [Pseudomonas aeruginosa]MCG0186034.1 hypothetical protein [Pseudomonas aeruginosa]